MNKKVKYIFLNISKSTVKFICFLCIFHTVNMLFMRYTEKFNEENRSGWSLAIMIFVAISVSWVFYHYNKRAQRCFLESCFLSENPRRRNTPIRALLSLDFISDAAVCCVFSLVSPFIVRYVDLEQLFFEHTSLHLSVQKLLIGIFIGMTFFLAQWFTVFDVRKKWIHNKEISSKNEIFIIAAYLCFITVMYTVGFYIAMAYVPGLYAYIFIFKELVWEILISIVVIVLLIYSNRIQKRRKFISLLKKISAKENYKLSTISKPYLSIFRKTEGASFAIKAHNKTYQCKLISGKRKGVPIIFSDQGFLVFRRIIHIGKSELFSIYSKYEYSFQSAVKKCLIITCIPAQCYFKDANGCMRKIDTGEKIGEYTIYSPEGFLGALERDCLDI